MKEGEALADISFESFDIELDCEHKGFLAKILVISPAHTPFMKISSDPLLNLCPHVLAENTR